MIKNIRDVAEVPPVRETEAQGLEYLPVSPKPRFGERLARNLALAGMLVLTVTAVRNAQLPTGQTVLTSVQDMIDSNWDESLGKISFVSNLFPETVSVFFATSPQAVLTAPCFGTIQHKWTAGEPYLGYDHTDGKVYALSAGQVMSLAHGMDEERIIRVRQEDGLETLYYNLASVHVAEGDQVTAETCLGEALADRQVVVEVRREGRAIDPTELISPRSEP